MEENKLFLIESKERMVNASTVVPLDITLMNAETKSIVDSKGNYSKWTSERVIVTTFQVPPIIFGTNIRIKWTPLKNLKISSKIIIPKMGYY